MLIDFTVSNYLSIKNEQTFSFVSESKTKDENALFSIENETIKLYPFSAIFGPNASGKSKFIYALEDLCNFVKESYKYGENQDIGGMAEAFYGVPDFLKEKCLEFTTKDMHKVLERFEERKGEWFYSRLSGSF